MHHDSENFWLGRLADSIGRARKAPSDRSRLAYLELAQHHRAMYHAARSARQRQIASLRPKPLAQDEFISHDFAFIDDGLMQAA